nr:DHHA1 domain-containing protein [Fangia hongkongensis]
MMSLRPKPSVYVREKNDEIYQYLCGENIDAFLANIIARRIDDKEKVLSLTQLTLKNLTDPLLMKGMDRAASRVIEALEREEVIGLETDHDCDGQTSHAILFEGLTKLFLHPKDKIRSYIGHRMEEGYGLSDKLAARILSDTIKPTLIITADNGSSDEERIALLKADNIDTIVTDHHAIPPEGVPKSAYSVINPTQKDCHYQDPYIAGCMVAWLLLAAVRKKLLDQNKLPNSSFQLTELLDFVAVGTVADCVSMAKSVNNRIVAFYGMRKISQKSRPCWEAFSDYFQHQVDSELLGFMIAPLLNSDGRMSNALSSVSFLLSEDVNETYKWVDFLQLQNTQRKAVQKKMTEKAMSKASKAYQKGNKSLCVYLEDGHAGVHGISASRIKDAFGLPTILFSPKLGESEVITGSARSVDGVNIKWILDQVSQSTKEVVIKYGGHTGAAGISIYKDKFDVFSEVLEKSVRDYIHQHSLELKPRIFCEGGLTYNELKLEIVDKLAKLEPFGREFEAPIFLNEAKILALRFVGKEQVHLQLMLDIEQKKLKAIWFFATEHDGVGALQLGDTVNVAYRLSKEHFKGVSSLSIKVEYLYK